MRTLDKRRIVEGPIGMLSAEDLEVVAQAVTQFYGL
jgi:hypothetical protein